MPSTTVEDDVVVSLDYTLRLDDGQVVDTSDDAEPLEFLQGRGQIIPGLEKNLYGMHVGEQKEVVVPPDDGYGEFDPEAFQQIPMDAFPADIELEPGMGMELMSETGEPFSPSCPKSGKTAWCSTLTIRWLARRCTLRSRSPVYGWRRRKSWPTATSTGAMPTTDNRRVKAAITTKTSSRRNGEEHPLVLCGGPVGTNPGLNGPGYAHSLHGAGS